MGVMHVKSPEKAQAVGKILVERAEATPIGSTRHVHRVVAGDEVVSAELGQTFFGSQKLLRLCGGRSTRG